MRSKIAPLLVSLLAALAISGCGRTHLGGETDGGGGGGDGDGPPPCTRDCARICQLAADCGTALPRQACLTACNAPAGIPPIPPIACLQQLVCSGSLSCSAARQCVINPQLPDLVVESLSASSPGRGQLRYTARVCNRGSGLATGIFVDFYRNRSSTPRPGERAPVVTSIRALDPGDCETVSQSESGLQSGVYRSWVQVDAAQRIVESNEGNNTRGPDVTSVQGGGTLADLTVRLTVSLGAQVGPNQRSVRYSARVCNNGSQSSGSTRVDIYYNRSSRPSSGSSGNRSIFVSSMQPGLCRTVTATSTRGPGTYRGWAYVDRLRQVSESNENNNIDGPRSITVPGGGGTADLRVTGLQAAPQPNGSRQYRVTTCNYGQGPAFNVRVAIYYNLTSRPTSSTPPSRTITLGTVDQGRCVVRSVPATLAPGTYRSWAYADYQNLVPELSESNNVLGPVVFNVSGSLPDLLVASFTSAPGPMGQTIYRVRVCNYGGVTPVPVILGLYYNRNSAPPVGTPPSRILYLTIGSGACTLRTFSATLQPGYYNSFVRIDSDDRVKESNESNNLRGPLKVLVGGTLRADLRIQSYTVQQTTGGTSFRVTVCNQGQAVAPPSQVGIYYNRPTAPSTANAPSATISLPSLSLGNCLTRSISRQLPPGSYRSWALADRANQVFESDESNNVAGPRSFTVQGGQSDLRIINFIGYQSGSSVVYQVTVCNFGVSSATSSRVGIYFNRASAPTLGVSPDRTLFISTLGAGACRTRSTSAQLQAGIYTSWAFADYLGQVSESDESNNVGGPSKITVGGGGQPDLHVASLSASAAPNGSVYYNGLVCNKGLSNASAVRVYLFYNLPVEPKQGQSGYARTSYLGTLAPGSCRPVTIVGAPPAGNLVSWLYVDLLNTVPESDESNNTAGVKVTVGGGSGGDLRLDSFTATTTASSTVIYSARVCNGGFITTAPTQLSIYDNLPAAPTSGTPPSRNLAVPPLSGGNCISIGASAALPAGSYRAWAFVDARNLIIELDETNNIDGPAIFSIGINPSTQCTTICKTLISPCNMLPATELSACETFCGQRTQAQRDCAYKAAQTFNCPQIPSCLFNP